ncbi:recombination protein RecO [Campylobacter sp.]|uniref:recombination protein RecO n=1 Tax=Campylobacter sp. TaxID=205 RepID=UPI00259CBB09|nr:recombination protein RecO [Campylobacter sp.]MBQ8819288.1 recombination protein RecO [Campylobacter sp.]MBQ8820964.1 recombination protein RecO [Campylobacter sp.]
MQGYILKVQKVRDEDCLVTILSPNKQIKCYRFYGARHPIITQGFKLDFELVESKTFLPHLRSTMHLGFSWLIDRDKLLIWQNFMRLLADHLRDVEDSDEFYYNLLENCAKKFHRQNPIRVVLEAYAMILQFEGRLHLDMSCFICDGKLGDEIGVGRAFLIAHPTCIGKNALNKDSIIRFLSTSSTAHLSDSQIKELYFILLEGF